MRRALKKWKVRLHYNRFVAFPYEDVEVYAYSRSHALTLVAMRPNPKAGHVKKSTASRVI